MTISAYRQALGRLSPDDREMIEIRERTIDLLPVEEGIQLRRAELGDDLLGHAKLEDHHTRRSLAGYFLENGQYDEAEFQYVTLLSYYADGPMSFYADVAESMSKTKVAKGDEAGARSALTDAIDFMRVKNGNFEEDVYLTYMNSRLLRFEWERNNYDVALTLLREINAGLADVMVKDTNKSDLFTRVARLHDAAKSGTTTLPENKPELLLKEGFLLAQKAVNSTSMAAVRTTARRRVAETAKLQAPYEKWESTTEQAEFAQARFQEMLSKGSAAIGDDAFEAQRQKWGDLLYTKRKEAAEALEELRQLDPSIVQLIRQSPVSIETIQREILRPDEVLIVFSVGTTRGQKTIAWAISQDSYAWAKTDVKTGVLEQMVNTLRSNLEG
ncbi:MAG: hypothetical protein V7727_22055, partial [Sneathiella sp.]